MSESEPPDPYRINKRQRSLDTSMQIPGIMQPSGAKVNKRPRARSPVIDEDTAIDTASDDLLASLAEFVEQMDELGMPIFSRAMSAVLDVASTAKRNQELETMIEDIRDLCYQVAVRLVQPLKEGKATSMIENTVEALAKDLQSTVTEYYRKSTEARYHAVDFEQNIATGFLESVICLFQGSLEMTRLSEAEKPDRTGEAIESMSRDTGETLEFVRQINAQNIAMHQMISSIHRESTSTKGGIEYSSKRGSDPRSRDDQLRIENPAPYVSRFEEAALNAIQPRVDSARYDSASQLSSSFCLEDTRVSLLDEIERWAEDPSSRPIFWLCGMAGTGKSTIARTVAKRFDERHHLGASFFFSRDEDDRRTANLVFPTIAYQIARRILSLREHIVKAATPDVCTAMLRTQLNKLIVEPFQRATSQSTPLVIVMDALDECTSESQITEMLLLLVPAIRAIRNTINIKLFLTSRPEVHISSKFKEPGMEAVSSVSILHDIEKSLVQADISRYIEYHLHRIAKDILPQDTVWPSSEEKQALVDMSDGLFIFAAVTIGYIGDTKDRRPKQRLRNILSASNQNQPSVSLRHLHLLYRQILIASLPDNDEDVGPEEIRQRVREILGTVVLLLYPLSSRSLEKLLQWEEDTVEPTLSPFHSVLSILPDPIPVRVFHKSFPDFLTDERRSGDFYVDPIEYHSRLALLCLTHMNNTLERDMCGVGNRLMSELGDVESILQTKVGGHVLYACRQWAAHLKEAPWIAQLGAALTNFCEHKLLYWLEIVCLDKKISPAILALDSARKWTRDDASSITLSDCYRYLLYHRNIISLGPSHIYRSTLPFVPRHNLSSSPWVKELRSSPRVVMTNDSDTWDRVLFTLTGHSRDVNAVAYSPNGVLLASGSDDMTVIIWDSRTGAQIHSLEGHSKAVSAVDFSREGHLIASGSDDTLVRIWNSVTGTLIHVLKGHSAEVTAVSFSPSGNTVASGSWDTTIILWDSGTGSSIKIIHGLTSDPCSISYSPDGAQIASDSGDSTIIIWDTKTGTIASMLKLDESHTVYFVAFSPDGSLLASTTSNEVILWDHRSRNIARKLEGGAKCVAFSPDGRFIVTGLDTGQIATWDITSGSQIGIFTGHTRKVASLAVSPDGSQIITGSYDGKAAVWDMKGGWGSPEGNNDSAKKIHTRPVVSIVFSPDGQKVASLAEDGIIAVWDIGGHKPFRMLNTQPHTQPQILPTLVRPPIAVSTDGRYVASGGYVSIIMWDTRTGESTTLIAEGDDGGEMLCLEFSTDGQYLVAVHKTTPVKRWHEPKIRFLSWAIQDCGLYQHRGSFISVEEATKILRGSPMSATPESESKIYLDEFRGSLQVKKTWQRTTIEVLCYLPHWRDITASASFGRTFIFWTRNGTFYVLDIPPEISGITSIAMYDNSNIFGFRFNYKDPDPPLIPAWRTSWPRYAFP